MIYLQLFWEFFKTGLFAIGGGMATMPFLYDLAEKTEWFTAADVTNMIAVSESTPGPLGVNAATYVGYDTAGVWGGIIASLGLVLPSLIIILIISMFLKAFRDNKYVDSAFKTLRPASGALIASAGIGVITIVLFNIDLFMQTKNFFDLISIKPIILAVCLIVLTRLPKIKKLHPIIFIVASAVVGIVFKFPI